VAVGGYPIVNQLSVYGKLGVYRGELVETDADVLSVGVVYRFQ
jgi:hypothetical protein